MSQAEILASLATPVRKHLDPTAPLAPRMMAAKGLAPLSPKDMVVVIAGLTMDEDPTLSDAARTTLMKLPEKILQPVLETDLPAPVWGVLAVYLNGRDDMLERVITNRLTPDSALAELAPLASSRIVEILAENQERCLRSEALVRGLRQNTNIMRSSLDRLFDFLVRAGVIFEDMPEFAESLSRLSPTELLQAADNIALPPEITQLIDSGPIDNELLTADLEIHEVGQDDDSSETPNVEADADVARVPLQKLIMSLNAAQKVALAMKGNKEARSILLRDANRMVATAAIRNPRLTEQEVVAAAKSRSINDEVMRIISNSREMMRSYAVKLALVNNPKTPLTTAMRLLVILRQVDLRNVAKSKSVPGALAVQAKKMLATKSTSG